MNLHEFRSRLERNVNVFRALFDGIDDEQARWRPAPEKWSMLEVVNHLYDEEREDFRARLDHVLHRPDEFPWPSIDPQAWVTSREYQKRDFRESVEKFLEERERSLAWLASIQPPNWESAYLHPEFPPMKGGNLMAAWVAHDYLHIRQITKLNLDYLEMLAAPYAWGYAGEW